MDYIFIQQLTEAITEKIPELQLTASFNEDGVILVPLKPVFEKFWHVDQFKDEGVIIRLEPAFFEIIGSRWSLNQDAFIVDAIEP